MVVCRISEPSTVWIFAKTQRVGCFCSASKVDGLASKVDGFYRGDFDPFSWGGFFDQFGFLAKRFPIGLM